MPDDILDDLEEARATIEATRRRLGAQGDPRKGVVDRLRRPEETVARVEGEVVGQEVEARS